MSLSSKTVVVAMSGGVDSSVAAALLKEQGYRVIGIMLRLWAEDHGMVKNRCCTPDSMRDAEEVADLLEIPFYVRDYKQIFFDTVVDFFKQSHLQKETPNPCLVCNREVRFGSLLKEAMDLGADYLATGHYARVEKNAAGDFLLKKGQDELKDQSYMLHRLNNERLSRALFPIGGYTKKEIRKMAEDRNLPVYKKSDSQDLCFIGDEKHGDFLKRHTDLQIEPGPIRDTAGKILGEHSGLAYYTIGQRKGLGIAAPEPLFVKEIDYSENALVVAPKKDCEQYTLFADRIHEINPGNLVPGREISGKIRYHAKSIQMKIEEREENRLKIKSLSPLFGVTPGQALAFYEEDLCLGGGILKKAPAS